MTENETRTPSALADVKKIWATPEIRDQNIKSATNQLKITSPAEYTPSGLGAAS